MCYGSTSHIKTEAIFTLIIGKRFYFTNTKLQNVTSSQGTEMDHTELQEKPPYNSTKQKLMNRKVLNLRKEYQLIGL